MNSILTVNTPAASRDLTALATVKAELGFNNVDANRDAVLASYISQASDMAEQECRRIFALEGVTETFWPEMRHHHHHHFGTGSSNPIILERAPVVSINSVTLDGTVLDPSLYRLDADAGFLYQLNSDGFVIPWRFSMAAIIAYSGGYELPDDLPSGVQRAVLQWIIELWRSKGRDPRLKSENVAGIGSQDFWVGQVDAGTLAPEQLLARYRRALVA